MSTAPPGWTLGYEAEGSTDAAWVIRDPATDLEPGTVMEVNGHLGPDDEEDAQAWAAEWLRQLPTSVVVARWQPHRPGPGTQPDYYEAVVEE